MGTPLKPDWENNYYKLKRAVTVEQLTGEWTPTNEWYGASRLHRAVRANVRLPKGTEIHALVGGLFAVFRSGKVVELSFDTERLLVPSIVPIAKHKHVEHYRGV